MNDDDLDRMLTDLAAAERAEYDPTADLARLRAANFGLTHDIIAALDNEDNEDNEACRLTFVFDEDYRKSASSQMAETCVEVRLTNKDAYIRDSKNRNGPRLHFIANNWANFINRIQGETQ